MSILTGTIASETSPTDGTITPDDGSADINYSDEEYGSKNLSVGTKVCYELVTIGSTTFATNLIKYVETQETVLDGGVHGPQTVGSASNPGALLRVIGGATVNGDIDVVKSSVIIDATSTINGNIRATQRSMISVQGGSTVTGFVNSHQGINLYIEGSSVADNVELKAAPNSTSQSFKVSGSDVGGEIDVSKGKSVIITDNNDSLVGDVSISKCDNVTVTGNTIGGDLLVRKPGTCKVCVNTVAGDTDVPDSCTVDC